MATGHPPPPCTGGCGTRISSGTDVPVASSGPVPGSCVSGACSSVSAFLDPCPSAAAACLVSVCLLYLSKNRGGRRFAGLTPRRLGRVATDQNWGCVYATQPRGGAEGTELLGGLFLPPIPHFTLTGEGQALTHPLANFLEIIFKGRAAWCGFIG